MTEKQKSVLINEKDSIISALQLMDKVERKLLIVNNEEKFISVLSIGDIQRAIIKNVPLDSPVSEIIRQECIVAHHQDSKNEIKKLILNKRIEFMPVVDDDNKLVNIYFWEDFFDDKILDTKNKFSLPVVIMAGGFGTRLKPITNVLPKPLIPIGENSIIEDIFNRFYLHGCSNFYISVNYKSDLIEYYLTHKELPYHLTFFKEEKPMGTAGSLSLLKGKIKETFFVSNCDILIDQDYSEILEYHRQNKNELTIVGALKHLSIPYGTIETGKDGKLIELREKPEITFKINSGMYILEPHLLEEIPENEFFHITHLIEKIKARNGNVGVFPVSQGAWRDIGEWDEYLKLIKD